MTVNVTSGIAITRSFYFHDCEGVVDECSVSHKSSFTKLFIDIFTRGVACMSTSFGPFI